MIGKDLEIVQVIGKTTFFIGFEDMLRCDAPRRFATIALARAILRPSNIA